MPPFFPAVPGYRLDAVLHRSSRVVVYRGVQVASDQPVVLKVPGVDSASLAQLARLRNEARVLRGISEDGIVRLLDEVQVGPHLGLVLADIGGQSLRQCVDGAPVEVPRFLELALAIARALDQVHRHGIVHRDLNPSNVVVSPHQVQLIDFGLSTTVAEESVPLEGGTLEGTIHYLSPEQTGRTHRLVDYRTDFYALGATFYQLLVGSPPFDSDDLLEVLHGHLARRPTPPLHVGEGLADLLMKLLAKSPEDRYQSATGLVDDLEACQAALARHGRIERFPLGRSDVSTRLHMPQGLYGREVDMAILEAGFTRATRGAFTVALLHGSAGVGKSSLVRELIRPIAQARGFLLAGKCDELHRQVPYFSLYQALRDMVRQVLGASRSALEGWKAALLAALGEQGGLLVEAVPDLERILGPQPPVYDVPPTEALHRQHRVLCNLLRVVADADHPAVLFLDDLQWVDLATLRLVETLAGDPAPIHLLLVGAYRGDEVAPEHPLQTTLDRLRAASIETSLIKLDDLAEDAAAQWIADALRCPVDLVWPLAHLVVSRTRGNPFFVKQFLATLHRDGLLRFDPQQRSWTWDLEGVRQCDITDNVADLMVRKIRSLSAETQEVVVTAACVGARFDLGVLSLALNRLPRQVAEELSPALDEGLVLAYGDGARQFAAASQAEAPARAAQAVYRFLHDRVRHAAASSISAERAVAMHLALGRRLYGRASDSLDDDGLFAVVHHFNLAHDLLEDVAERDRVASLNLVAGRRAARAAAFATARQYLDMAIRLCGEQGWSRQHALLVDAHLEAAAAASAGGDSARVQALTEALLQHADGPLERARALDVRIGECLMRNHFQMALTLGLSALAELGERFPSAPSKGAMAAQVGKTMLALAGTPLESLAHLAEGDDPHHRMVMGLLSRTHSAAFPCRPDLMTHLGVRIILRTIRYGVTAESARGFAMFGVIQANVLGNIPLGDRYGRLALALSARFPASVEHVQVFFGVHHLIRPWCSPMRPIVQETLERYRQVVEGGDYANGQLLAWAYCRMSYQSGTPLPVLDAEVTRMMRAVETLRQGPVQVFWTLQRRVIDNLMGRSSHAAHLEGADVILGAADQEDRTAVWTAALEQGWLFYLFGEWEAAMACLPPLETLLESMLGRPEVPQFHTLASLVRLAVLPSRPSAGRRTLRRAVEESHARLRKWAEHSPANCSSHFHLVDAELARAGGETAVAARAYDAAVEAARTHGFGNDEALALERAGTLYQASGRERLARVYLTDAVAAWERWGAAAKAAQVRALHSDLLAPAQAGDNSLASASTSKTTLDLMTVMKASQAMSGEIVLDRLLQRMLSLSLESAGAQRAFLVLERDGALMVEADGDVDRDPVVVVATRTLDDMAGTLAASVVQYVARTHEVLVCDDAASDTALASDRYVARMRPRSIMGVPVATQGKDAGVLYVENNLASHAFTAGRQQVLRVLASQAAISLENARLYAQVVEQQHTLEQRVAERTEALRGQNDRLEDALRRLQQAQEQVVTQQKLAYLGTLTAGIAHEIRNPLNFVTNFAVMTADLLSDAREAIAPLPAQVCANLQETLDALEQNAGKICEHAARADRVVQSMLLHAGTSSGEREPVDLNVLVLQSAELAKNAQTHRLAVEVTVTPDMAMPPVTVAPRDMARAFLNVIGNAVYAAGEKAQREGRGFRPLVQVTTRATPGGAEVRVRDNGDGIPLAIRDQVFAPFFTTRPSGQGTGLGLSITYDIVVGQHGGKLSLESEPGQFAEFVIELPGAESHPVGKS